MRETNGPNEEMQRKYKRELASLNQWHKASRITQCSPICWNDWRHELTPCIPEHSDYPCMRLEDTRTYAQTTMPHQILGYATMPLRRSQPVERQPRPTRLKTASDHHKNDTRSQAFRSPRDTGYTAAACSESPTDDHTCFRKNSLLLASAKQLCGRTLLTDSAAATRGG